MGTCAAEPRTRIVCTLGPASESPDVLRAMVHAGMDVARINFSHGDQATHAARIRSVRKLAQEENAVVAILVDLQGPKIRVGEISGGSVELVPGSRLTLSARPVEGTRERVHVDFPMLAQWVKPGNHILLDDGELELEVISSDAAEVVTQVVNGGYLLPHKGVNLPGIALPIPALTEKDYRDLKFAIDQGVDYIALSFVRKRQDVAELRSFLSEHSAATPIVAKIEKPEAIADIDGILDAADGVMVARGDLGVEAPPEQVPLYQKAIIRKANAAGKPVITATQMLESMVTHERPTRAEASDVANAILDGTDAIMLSAETAIGKYPVESVETMARIAHAVEGEIQHRPSPAQGPKRLSIADAIGSATCEIAQQLGARVILTATTSGSTARMISRHRPHTPIFAVTSSEETRRRLALVWGIQCVVVPLATNLETMISQGIAVALEHGVVQNGDRVVVTAGVPAGVSGRTNMLQVRTVGETS